MSMKPGDEMIWKDSGTYRHCHLWSVHTDPPCVKVRHRGAEWILNPNEVISVDDYENMLLEKQREEVRVSRCEMIRLWSGGVKEASQLASTLGLHHLAVWNCLKQLKRLELIHD